MYYVSDFINVDDASINNIGLSNEEGSMEMFGEMLMSDTTQKVFNYTGTTNDMFSLWIDEQPIITGVATANSEGVYTPATTGWKKIRVKWSNRGSTGDFNITYKNNASTCAGSCINIPSNLLRVYAPQTAWYKAGTQMFTDTTRLAPTTTDHTHIIRWDSVSPIFNPAGRTDSGNFYESATADLINGNPVIDNISDKFLVGTNVSANLETNRLSYTWGLPMMNTGRTLMSVATASSPTTSQHLLTYGDDGTPTARYHFGLYNSGGEMTVIDHQVNFGELTPGTIENQTAQTPFIFGGSYNGGDSTATTANTTTLWGNGKRTYYRTPSISMQTNDQLQLRLNGSNYDSVDWTGRVAEHILYPWELSTTQRQRVDSYLAMKYGTTYIGGESNLHNSTTNTAALSVGQVFTSSVTGGLNAISLVTGATANASTATLYLCNGAVSAAVCIANTGSVQLQAPQVITTVPTVINTPFTITLTTPLEVTAGTQYTMVLGAATNVYLQIQGSDTYLGGNQVGFGTQDIKFSLDVRPDIVSSTGTILWSYDSYHNYVTAIGRDDASGLNQTSSLSTANNTVTGSQGIVTITKTGLANGDFLVIGDNTNNGVQPNIVAFDNYSTWMNDASIPSGYMRPGKSGTPNNFIEWRARETGTDNAYTLSINLENTSRNMPDVSALNNTLYVLFDSDGDALLSDEVLNTGILPMYDDGTNGDTVAGDKIYTAQNIDLDDTDKFTFIQTTLPTPGAVSGGISGWYKANEGVFTDVSGTLLPANTNFLYRWNDFSGNSNTMTQSNSSYQPTYNSTSATGAVNFNPTVNFSDGGNDNFMMLAGTASLFSNTTPGRVFAVGTRVNTSGTWNSLIQQGTGNANNPMFGIYDNYPYYYDNSVNYSNSNTTTIIPGANTAFMLGFSWATPSAGVAVSSQLNGVSQIQGTFDNTFGSGPTQISESQVNENWDGNLAEVITYQSAPSAIEAQRVESYLAIKYGITLQKSLEQNLTFDSNSTSNASIGQTFTASATGQINALTLQTSTTANAGTGTLYICNGASLTTTACINAPAYTQSITVPTNTSTIFTVPITTPFSVTSASQYTFVLTSTTGNANYRFYSAGTNYTGGTILYTSGTATQDLYFRVDYLPNDYLLSNNTSKVYTALNNGWNQDITAIARDDGSDLDQRKSKSVNISSIVTIGHGTSLTTPTAFSADLSGMSLAHNLADSRKWTTSGAPTGTNIVARSWKVEKTGTIGTVTIAINTENTAGTNYQSDLPPIAHPNGRLYLVVDDEAGATPNFTDETVVGSTIIRLYDDGTNGDQTANDKVYTVNNLTFPSGAFFTVAQDTPPTPGGVGTGLKAWYKAGSNVYTDTGATTVPTEAQAVSRWLDISGNNKTLISGTTPDYRIATSSQAINFNPAVDFQ
jgi:hypothetical protein